MGDRGNIVVRQTKDTNRDDVWFYTHWRGSEIKSIAAEAIKRNQRHGDPAYFTRIVASELFGDMEHSDDTGFGISTRMQDNEHDIVVIDLKNKVVHIIHETELVDFRLLDKIEPRVTDLGFDGFVSQNT